jgi:type IV pilus assembly protein PilN
MILAATIFLGFATWTGLDYYMTSSTLNEKQSLLQQEKLLVQTQVKNQQNSEPAISSVPLREKVEYIRGKEIAAAELLQHLVALLPERGFFMKYEYKDQSTITVEAQFDTLAESSQYLYELTNSPYLTDAEIEQVQTSNLEEVEEGKDMSEFENVLPRYRSQYKIEFQKEKLLELKGENNGGQ